MKLVECVPNFSEGCDMKLIGEITGAIEAVEGVSLLDVDPGAGTNRTVVTFVAPPEAAVEAAYRGIEKSAELIQMSTHSGAHARIGATDVCPFVPVSGVTIEDCVKLAEELAARVGKDLNIPVYLYEAAATSPERKSLPNIRKGEYEGLREKLADPVWKPDFGPAKFNEKSGATVIGVRPFLVAYNINLNTKNTRLARKIGLTIREKGRARRDENGKIVRDEKGKKIFNPGLLKECKATGWYIPEYRCAQVTMNLTDFRTTSIQAAFDTVTEVAAGLGLRVTGSEIVGLVPLEALVDAGRHYLELQGASRGVSEADLIRMAVDSLGLNVLSAFDPEEKIIEYRVRKRDGLLTGMKTNLLVDEVSADSPTPGGGSVSSLAASLGAALVSMVANLTWGKKGYDDVSAEVEKIAVTAQELKGRLLSGVDDDTDSFNALMACSKLPKKTPYEKEKRERAIQEATVKATSVPLSVLEDAVAVLEIANRISEIGNRNSISDAGVAGLMAAAGAEGAHYNVLINLPGIKDASISNEYRAKGARLLEKAHRLTADLKVKINTSLGEASG